MPLPSLVDTKTFFIGKEKKRKEKRKKKPENGNEKLRMLICRHFPLLLKQSCQNEMKKNLAT